MKKLLLAFALIGFIATSSFASTTIVKASSETVLTEDGDGDKKCTKKDCKHNTKECTAAAKKECKKGDKKSCCANKATASKGKSCHGAKAEASKTASTKNVKKENKDK